MKILTNSLLHLSGRLIMIVLSMRKRKKNKKTNQFESGSILYRKNYENHCAETKKKPTFIPIIFFFSYSDFFHNSVYLLFRRLNSKIIRNTSFPIYFGP